MQTTAKLNFKSLTNKENSSYKGLAKKNKKTWFFLVSVELKN